MKTNNISFFILKIFASEEAVKIEQKNAQIEQDLRLFNPSFVGVGALIVIASFLSFEQKRLFAEASGSRAFKLFYQNRIRAEIPIVLIPKLLNYVGQGEQTFVRKILEKYPELLLKKGNVIDHAGRHFKNITAFQCALWADDMHMYCMMENLVNDIFASALREKLREALKNQREELEQMGVTFEFKGGTYRHQHYFSREPILNVLKKYIDNYSTWTSEQRNDCLRSFRQLQIEFPACLAQEICNRKYYPNLPSFREDTLIRDLGLGNFWFNNHKKKYWFDSAIPAIFASELGATDEQTGRALAEINLAGYIAYNKVRINDRAELRMRHNSQMLNAESGYKAISIL